MLKKILLLTSILIINSAFAEQSIKMDDVFIYDWKMNEYSTSTSYNHRIYAGVKGVHYNTVRNNNTKKKDANGFGTHSKGTIKFIKLSTNRNNIIIDAIVHNTSKSHYQCFYISTGEEVIHLDDELANEYIGTQFELLGGKGNKLSLNQRKKLKITMPRPPEDVDLVNLHLGFQFVSVESNENCKKILVDWKLNFHKLDWNIAPLRSN